ncbi:hypothetical protein FFV09_19275 [Saccharibacillus brassicae]|uniref:Uncharacterized protein n=1 Tax=Saccharibacillus brassicae TaxID=2583377 RepID=A0A4Y6UYG5_SACBS|nr:hypothetical protein FFV09_19275 [Saccharibacillus brassicae]
MSSRNYSGKSRFGEAWRTHGLTDSRTLGLTDSRTHGLTDSRTHGLTDSRTRQILRFLQI